MLTKLLIQDEMTASLGKTENSFTVDVSGKTTCFHAQVCQSVTQENRSHKPVLFRLSTSRIGV
jgi:hypothetical protein